MPSELLTTAEVAQLLRVSTKTVTRWVRLDQLDAVRLPSGGLRFRREDIDALVRRQRDNMD